MGQDLKKSAHHIPGIESFQNLSSDTLGSFFLTKLSLQDSVMAYARQYGGISSQTDGWVGLT